MENHFKKLKTANQIYCLDKDKMNINELNMAVSLQGVVAQKLAQIAISVPKDWKDELCKNYGIVFIEVDSVWTLVAQFKDSLKGLVTYDSINDLNKASTASAAFGFLAVHKDLAKKAVSLGLSVQIDASSEYSSEYDAFVKCKDHLDNTFICHQLPNNWNLRDFAIAVKAPIYASNVKEELSEIYDWVQENGAVIGWYYDEVTGVGYASSHGIMTIPSDHAANLSLYSGVESRPQKQKPIQKLERKNKKTHYVTFLLSDGDNVQVHVNSYRTHNYASKLRGTVPFGWSTSPSMYDIAPFINSWYYDRQTGYDDFLTAVSGVGYCNPALLPKETLKKYAALSAEYMKKSSIVNTVLLMDSPEDQLVDPNETEINNLYAVTNEFSSHDGIEGGFLYYGTFYRPDKTPGAVFWNHGKPFNAVRETLWHDGSKAEYLTALAQKINSYPKDCTVVEGYTAINVQYWQYNFDEVAAFAKLLDEDVVVVTPREFLDIMKTNVADQTTKLYLD